MKLLKTIIFNLLFLLCFNVHGMETTDKKSPELSDALSTENSNVSYIEKAQFDIKGTFKFLYYDPTDIIYQIPLLLELQVPIITAKGNIKWLLQVGGGLFWLQGGECSILDLAYWKCQNNFFVMVQTGFKYNFQPFSLSLIGGTTVNFDNAGWSGDLLLGWRNKDSAVYIEIGPSLDYYNDRLYFGATLSVGFTVKKWWNKIVL